MGEQFNRDRTIGKKGQKAKGGEKILKKNRTIVFCDYFWLFLALIKRFYCSDKNLRGQKSLKLSPNQKLEGCES